MLFNVAFLYHLDVRNGETIHILPGVTLAPRGPLAKQTGETLIRHQGTPREMGTATKNGIRRYPGHVC
jgi:hypothetical protein